MYITINRPVAFSHIGQRTSNQDTVYPAVEGADDSSPLFLVCDGMGGADKGEVASQLLCREIGAYAETAHFPVFDGEHLKAALEQAYAAYYAYLKQHPFVNRMGSTLALLQFHEQGATVAHLGDSRVYQVRGGKIIFQTKDHKQVNDMVEAGIITAVQAQTHPWRNRLSRAVVVNAGEVPRPSAVPEPELSVLTDVRAGDSFFMCTDGVLEQIDDYALEAIVSGPVPDQAKIASLLALCHDKTKDNYSGYLISVKNVQQTSPVPKPVAVP
ncbi:protein phosphatase [Larkinella arboricola]|uniref:Protein phosphatase n=1 Tax=Larkinella arboricola TaxID=643671 RepID=A0A327WN26_LARAB|nr:protein phosphatase 2C domain-containing protein [Larkinella arboricola]RAJ93091.1 protein phosphatase [Larkinella arboricola]